MSHHLAIKYPPTLEFRELRDYATGGHALELFAEGSDGSRLSIVADRTEWQRVLGHPVAAQSDNDRAVAAYLRDEIDIHELERRLGP